MSSNQMPYSMAQKLVAEWLGTAMLLVIVVGSGIMAQQLAEGNIALALLANALATGAGLYVLIEVCGPISGAHFNPIVSLAMAAHKSISSQHAIAYIGVQILGALCGVALAHAMFDIPAWFTPSVHVRSSSGQFISEVVASVGLLVTIFATSKHKPSVTPVAVAAYITAAYWFTASTSFANPAVTIARCLTDTFAGIRPSDVPAFILAQLVGCALALVLLKWMQADKSVVK